MYNHALTTAAEPLPLPPLHPVMVELLLLIFDAMLEVEPTIHRAIHAHDWHFRYQLAGMGLLPQLPPDEPYLPQVQAKFELQFLTTMERLIDTLERNLAKKQLEDTVDWVIGMKAIDYRHPLPEQITERIATEQQRLTGRVQQELDRLRQQATGIHSYIWQTQEDDKVRPAHAANDGRLFAWAQPPATGHPGQEYNCRCTAQPATGHRGEPVVETIDIAGMGRALAEAIKILQRARDKIKRLPKPKNISVDNLTLLQRRNLERFNKKLPKGAHKTTIQELPNGNKVFQADVPARNIPKSFARYEKTIDSKGKTVKYTKTTFGSNGEIIHIKEKLKVTP